MQDDRIVAMYWQRDETAIHALFRPILEKSQDRLPLTFYGKRAG